MQHTISRSCSFMLMAGCSILAATANVVPSTSVPAIESSVKALLAKEDRTLVASKISCPLKINAQQPLKLVGMRGYPTLVFSPDNHFLAATDRSGGSGLMIWDMLTGKGERIISKGWLGEIAFSPNGEYIVVGSAGGAALLINLANKHSIELAGHTRSINTISFSPDGQSIATASADNTTRIWSLDGKPQVIIQGLPKAKMGGATDFSPYMSGVSWSATGEFMTIASQKQIQVQRLPNVKKSIIESTKGFLQAKFSPDGATIATVSTDGVRLWDTTGRQLSHWSGHSEQVTDLHFSSDGQTIVTASEDKTASLWNLDGKVLNVFRGHKEPLTATAFSHDNQCVFTNSMDNTVRLWDISGQELARLTSSFSMVVSPDSQYLATTEDDAVLVWKLK
jgi:WD40 repeat protein